MQTYLRYTALSIGLSLLVTESAFASDWTADVVLRAENEYQHNPDFSESNEEEVIYTKISPNVEVTYSTETLQIDLLGDFEYNMSSNEDVQKDYLKFTVGSEAEYNFENGSVFAGFDFTDDSVFNTEFEDTNRFVSNVSKKTTNLDFGGDYQISENYLMGFSQSFTDVTYDSDSFTDFISLQSQLSLGTDVSETLNLSNSLGFGYFDPDSPNQDISKTYSYNISAIKSFENDNELDVTVGIEHAAGQIGWRLVGTYSSVWEASNAFLTLSRESNPSGSGVLRETNRVRVGYNYIFSQDLDLRNQFSYSESSQTGDRDESRRESADLNSVLSWELSEDWNLNLRYIERAQKQDDPGKWIHSRSASVFLQHNFSYQ